MQGEASTRLGFTDYFRVELAWAKLLGAVLLLAPVSTGWRLATSCRTRRVEDPPTAQFAVW